MSFAFVMFGFKFGLSELMIVLLAAFVIVLLMRDLLSKNQVEERKQDSL